MKEKNRARDNAKNWMSYIRKALSTIDKLDRGKDPRNETAEFDGEQLTAEDIRDRLMESPLAVEIRRGWCAVGHLECHDEAEYRILLTTGGPALRVVGKLQNGNPYSAALEYQDWGTPWTAYRVAEHDEKRLVEFASLFYYGDGLE